MNWFTLPPALILNSVRLAEAWGIVGLLDNHVCAARGVLNDNVLVSQDVFLVSEFLGNE